MPEVPALKRLPTNPLLTVADVAKALSISRATVYRLKEVGDLEKETYEPITRKAAQRPEVVADLAL
jgi:hypothetical protein